jgi:hypothetical protein
MRSSPLTRRPAHAFVMFHLIVLLARFLRSPDAPSHAAGLMQDADARAGLDAHHAEELRIAASAWLRVVR